MTKTPKRVTKSWCKRTRGKTQAQRKKCHRILTGESTLPKRKYKRKKSKKSESKSGGKL